MSFQPIHQDHNEVKTLHTSLLNPGHSYAVAYVDKDDVPTSIEIHFQNGAVKENGINGITNEALLAILIHRTSHLNDLFPCQENEDAISAMKQALASFEARTQERIQRGVEGECKA